MSHSQLECARFGREYVLHVERAKEIVSELLHQIGVRSSNGRELDCGRQFEADQLLEMPAVHCANGDHALPHDAVDVGAPNHKH